MIKQHKKISFLVLTGGFESQATINLNELGVNTKSLQSI